MKDGNMHESDMSKGVAENKEAKPGAKETSMHQGAMNSVRPQKPGPKKPSCSLHDSVHC